MNDNLYAPPTAQLAGGPADQPLAELGFPELKKLYSATVNIRVLAALYGLGTLLYGVLAAVSLDSEPELPWLPAVFLLLALLSLVACITNYTRAAAGRPLGMTLCALNLFSFPIGTVIGVVGLIAYSRGARLFGAGRLPHRDVVAAYKQRRKARR